MVPRLFVVGRRRSSETCLRCDFKLELKTGIHGPPAHTHFSAHGSLTGHLQKSWLHNSHEKISFFCYLSVSTVLKRPFWYKMFLFVAFEVVFFFLHSLCVSLSTICFHFIWICSKQTWMKRISVPEVEKSLDAPLNRMFNWPKIWRPTTPEGVKKQITKYPNQS